MEAANYVLLMIALVFVTGIVAGRLAEWLRVPDVVLYLLAGIVIGPAGFGWLQIGPDSMGTQLIFTFGAAFMLYEGGREVDLAVFRRVWVSITLLSTTGVLVTAAVVGLAAMLLFHLDVIPALLLAAVIAPTDPATIIPIFKQIRLIPRLSQTAQAESAFNDATGSILAFTLAAVLQAGGVSASGTALRFLVMVVGGIVIGGVVSWAAHATVSGGRRGLALFGANEASSVVSVVVIIAAYLAAEAVGASGFMAVFVAGIVAGNKPSFHLESLVGHDEAHHHFFSVNGLVMRMMIFVVLGSHVNFALVGQYLAPSLVLMVVFMFIARPLTVLTSLLPDRRVQWQRNEIIFLMWVRETGVIPAALAGLLVGMGLKDAQLITSVVFVAILSTLLLQASTTPLVARRLGVLAREEQGASG